MGFREVARGFVWVGVAWVGTGCATSVRVPVLQPALVDVPGDVRVIGVVDRSAPKNVGQGILGTLEGIATGEGLMVDREGAAEAVDSLVRTLEASPRFEVVIPANSNSQLKSGIFDKALDHRTVKRICRMAKCDALAALEVFDSDSGLLANGQAVPELGDVNIAFDPSQGIDVQRDTRVLASWRLYDARANRILDEVRDHSTSRSWTQHGDSVQQARSSLPNQRNSVRTIGRDAGLQYGARIAPTWVDVSRTYYSKGHPQLKQAKHYVRAGDWKGARELWRKLLDDADPKARGRAAYNLALALEVDGGLEAALGRAREAAVALHNPRSRQYVAVLEQRLRDQERLAEQLAPAPVRDEVSRPSTKSSKPTRPTTTKPSGSDGSGTTMTRPK